MVNLAGLLLARGDLPELGFQLAATVLQPAGHLGEEVVAVLDPGPDIAGAVLELALALEIEGVEQHLGDGFRILLRQQPLRELARDSLVGQQFLQIHSNKEPALGREAERRPRDGDRCCLVFSRCWFSFGPDLRAWRAEGLGRDWSRNWTAPEGAPLKILGQFRRGHL